MSEKKSSGWDDIDVYMMPIAEVANLATVEELSAHLCKANNHTVHYAQYEPELKRNLELAKTDLEDLKRDIEREMYKDMAAIMERLKPEQKKNKDLILGNIYNDETLGPKHEEYETKRRELQKNLAHHQYRYDQLYRRIRMLNMQIEIGKPILYALKEEAKNLNT